MMAADALAAGSSSTLDEDVSIEICRAKASRSSGDGRSSAMAKKYNITRDVEPAHVVQQHHAISCRDARQHS